VVVGRFEGKNAQSNAHVFSVERAYRTYGVIHLTTDYNITILYYALIFNGDDFVVEAFTKNIIDKQKKINGFQKTTKQIVVFYYHFINR